MQSINSMKDFVDRMSSLQPHKDTDYVSQGILYCGDCKTPKQAIKHLVEGEPDYIVPIMCQCQEIAREKRIKIQKYDNIMAEIGKTDKYSILDKSFKEANFDKLVINADNKENIEKIKNYTDNFDKMLKENKGLFLFGDMGTGKTYLASCVANELKKKLYMPYATSITRIINDKDYKENEKYYLGIMNMADLLIIDDFGTERRTDAALELVYNIIDSRYRANKPMIITTNLTIKEMQEEENIRLQKLYERIFGICIPIKFKGESWRKKKARDNFEEMKKYFEED